VAAGRNRVPDQLLLNPGNAMSDRSIQISLARGYSGCDLSSSFYYYSLTVAPSALRTPLRNGGDAEICQFLIITQT